VWFATTPFVYISGDYTHLPSLLPGMLRKTETLGFLSGMLLPFFKCKESFGYVGVVVNDAQGKAM